MRSGRTNRADAITNSPFVRALIKPIVTRIEPPLPFPTPSASDLISTQPSKSTAVTGLGGMSNWSLAAPIDKGKKREREEDDQFQDKIETVLVAEVVEVRYNSSNLPPELNKCRSKVQRL